jgi:hypothetical protein
MPAFRAVLGLLLAHRLLPHGVPGLLRTLTLCALGPRMDFSVPGPEFRTATDYSVPDA